MNGLCQHGVLKCVFCQQPAESVAPPSCPSCGGCGLIAVAGGEDFIYCNDQWHYEQAEQIDGSPARSEGEGGAANSVAPGPGGAHPGPPPPSEHSDGKQCDG